ncbi:MAG: glycosyltransferase family 4 protein [Actinomycetota bacterium]|nr:glycosyltransferase family 4 protein [Actinomycetota bacterium]
MTATPPLAYLTKRFPRLSETFILDEILALEGAGVPLRLYAIADPGETVVQPDVAKVRSPVGYLRPRGSAVRMHLRFLRSHATLLRRRPRRWLAVVAHIAIARRHRSTVRHFLEAGVLAVEVERIGAAHLHAAFAHGPASVAHFVHLLTGVPFSFAAHAKDLYLSSPDLLARKVAASSFVLTCSASAAADLERAVSSHWDPSVRAHTGKIVLALHGVDVERFMPTVPRAEEAPLRILAVGRLVPKKGYSDLLAALRDLADMGTAFECRIIGGGDGRGRLAGLAADLGLDGYLSFTGALPQTEIIDHYAWGDVFVQASVVTADGDRDGIPNSVMEAMACGLPVVATAVAGIPEVVQHGTSGLLVPPGQPAALAAALFEISNDAVLRRRLGGNARRHTVEHLSRADCARAVAARFLHAVGAPAGPPPDATPPDATLPAGRGASVAASR